jgi:hypothetical protein
MVLLLLANGADPNIVCKDMSPLWLACYHGLLELVFPLLDNGADPNFVSNGASSLHVATARGLVEVVSVLLDFERGANVNLATDRLGTALHVAINRGHRFVLDVLLSHKPDLSVTNRFGETILHLACRLDDDKIATTLLNSKLPIDPFQKDRVNGSTIAHLTTSPKLFRTLLKRWPQLLYANDDHNRSPTFYMHNGALDLFTSITSKLVEQCGPHLHSEIDQYADLILVCPLVSPLTKSLILNPNGQSPAQGQSFSGSEAIVSEATADLAQVSISQAPPQRISCHRAMMSARASGFMSLLDWAKEAPSSTSKASKQYILDMPEYCADVMNAIVYYCYTDMLKCAKDNLAELAIAAKQLGIPRLERMAKGKLGQAVEAGESSYVAELAALLHSNRYTDVKIIINPRSASSSATTTQSAATSQSKTIESHRFLLAAFSEYFATMFSVGLIETHSGVVELSDVTWTDFDAFLHWIYTYSVKPTVKTAQATFKMLELSSHFLCPDMALPLQTKLLSMLVGESYINVAQYIKEADRLGAQLLYEQCAAWFNGNPSRKGELSKQLDAATLQRFVAVSKPRPTV